MAGWYLLAIMTGLIFNIIGGNGEGFHLFNEEATHVIANVMTMLVSMAIIPEAYANGLFTKIHHWTKRGLKLFFWLSIGLVIRAFAVYYVSVWFGFENPLAVSGGLLATDPAAVGLALGMVKAAYLDAMFWQLTVESLLNDAVGISVYGVSQGQSLAEALMIVYHSVLLAIGLALSQTVARKWLRATKQHDTYEIPVILGMHAVAFGLATHWKLSLILVVAVAQILGDWLDEIFKVGSATESIYHNWERLNNGLLAVLLGIAAFMIPVHAVYMDLQSGGKILLAGLSLLIAVGVSRFVVELATRVLGKFVFRNGKWGHDHGWEVLPVNTLAGWTMLGVPTIVALELGSHGHMFDASAMLVAIGLSWLFIYPTVKVIETVENQKLQDQH